MITERAHTGNLYRQFRPREDRRASAKRARNTQAAVPSYRPLFVRSARPATEGKSGKATLDGLPLLSDRPIYKPGGDIVSEQEELLETWSILDNEDRESLLAYALLLSTQTVLQGGPYDGLRLDPMVHWGLSVNVKHTDGTVATYIADKNRVFFFDCCRKRGEGVQPDVYSDRGAE